jgi:PAS domain S-box-containing protein
MEKGSLNKKDIPDEKFLNALAEAFRLQETILNAAELPIVSVTPDGMITTFNKAAEKLTGYHAEELIGKCTPIIFHDLDELVKRSQQLSEELGIPIEPVFDVFNVKPKLLRVTYREEWALIRKDGSRFPALLSVSALRDDYDTITGYLALIHDLTEIKQTDERARESEKKFQLLAENIPGAIYLCKFDEPYSVIYINKQIEDITGYPVEDFISGKITFSKLFHPEDVSMINTQVRRAVDEKRRFHLRYRMRHRSGTLRWVDETGVGVFDNGELTMLEGYISDITTQKEAEEKLQKIVSENLRVFNSSVNLNVITGFDGYFKRVSRSWTTLLGWTELELLSKPFAEFVHPDDLETTQEVVKFITAGNNLHTFENRYQCKDGSYRWLLWSSAVDLAHEVIYASAVDITERKAAEEKLIDSKKSLESIAGKLQEQNRQLDEFAHIISHNLRSPVGNIQALINLLDDKSSIDDYKLIFDKLKNVAKNLSDTMNDLMDTLKAKTQSEIDRVEIRFKDLLDKVVQSLEGELIIAEAAVTFDFEKAPVIYYPKAYLESIFQNLLSNSLKYRSPDRKAAIHFESSLIDNSIELRVTDNGQGIDLEKFGDKLFGLHRTFHSHQEARGVGLFLIKTQIESMGGTITAESTVDKGTTFIIRFG